MVCCKHRRTRTFPHPERRTTTIDRTKLITSLVILCLASAVAAFLMPPAHGALLSFVSIASAAVIAVLAVVTLVRMLMQRRAF